MSALSSVSLAVSLTALVLTFLLLRTSRGHLARCQGILHEAGQLRADAKRLLVDARVSLPGAVVTATSTSGTTEQRREWQVQEYVGDHWLPVFTHADRARVAGRLDDCRTVHQSVDRSFRLVQVSTTRLTEVETP